MTEKQLAEYWQLRTPDGKITVHSIRKWTARPGDEQRAAKLKEFFGQQAIRDITPMLIEKFKSELRKSDSKLKRLLSPSTVNRYLQVLSRILSI